MKKILTLSLLISLMLTLNVSAGADGENNLSKKKKMMSKIVLKT